MNSEKPLKTSENLIPDNYFDGSFRLIIGIQVDTHPSKITSMPTVDGFDCKFFIDNDKVIFTIESKSKNNFENMKSKFKGSHTCKEVFDDDEHRKHREDRTFSLLEKAFAVLSIMGLLFQSSVLPGDEPIPYAVPKFVKIEGYIDKFHNKGEHSYQIYKSEPISCDGVNLLSPQNEQYTFVGKNFSLIKLDHSNVRLPLFTDKKCLKKYLEKTTKFKEIKF